MQRENQILKRVKYFLQQFPPEKIHLSASSLRKLDPLQKGTPRHFCLHYSEQPTLELDSTRALIEYLILGEQSFYDKYAVVDALNTTKGKEQKAAAEANKKKWIKKADVEKFKPIYDGLELCNLFMDNMADMDVQKCQFQSFDIEHWYNNQFITFKGRRFVHFVKQSKDITEICILKEGSFEDASSWAIKKAGIPLHAAMHSWGYKGEIKVKVIGFNTKGDVCVFNLSQETIQAGINQVRGLLTYLCDLYNNPNNFSNSYQSTEHNGEWTI